MCSQKTITYLYLPITTETSLRHDQDHRCQCLLETNPVFVKTLLRTYSTLDVFCSLPLSPFTPQTFTATTLVFTDNSPSHSSRQLQKTFPRVQNGKNDFFPTSFLSLKEKHGSFHYFKKARR